jgi:hypothetical protein
MTKGRSLLGLAPLVLAAITAGCAPAYYSYSGCSIDCGYCPPPPLPYTRYDHCACHACAVQRHLAAGAAAAQPIDTAD